MKKLIVFLGVTSFFYLLFLSCKHELGITEVVSKNQDQNSNPIVNSFYDEEFDPYTDSPMQELSNSAYIDDFVDGLSFFSDYFAGDTTIVAGSRTPDQLVLSIYNAYLASKSMSPIGTYPMDCHLSISQRTGVSTTVKNALNGVLNSIDPEEEIGDAYPEFRDILDHLNLSSYTNQQKDTIATVLYAIDITMNWALNDDLFAGQTHFSGNPNQIQPRCCYCWYPHNIPWAGWKCAGSIFLGAFAGAEAGAVGAIAGGWFGGLAGC